MLTNLYSQYIMVVPHGLGLLPSYIPHLISYNYYNLFIHNYARYGAKQSQRIYVTSNVNAMTLFMYLYKLF